MSHAAAPMELPVLPRHVAELKAELRETQELVVTRIEYINTKFNNRFLELAGEIENMKLEKPTPPTRPTLSEFRETQELVVTRIEYINTKFNNRFLELAEELENMKLEKPTPLTQPTLSALLKQTSKRHLAEAMEPYRHMMGELSKAQVELASELGALQADVCELKGRSASQSMPVIRSEQKGEALSDACLDSEDSSEEEKPAESAEEVSEKEKPLERVTQVSQKEQPASKFGEEVTLGKLHAHNEVYVVQESSWDSCAFVGFKCIGTWTVVLILISVLLTIATGVLFCLIVYANYTKNPFNDDMLEGLLHWRATVAHNIGYADPATSLSLASRVCHQSTSLEMSGRQLRTFSDLLAYSRSPVAQLRNLNGFVLCNLALILWLFAITKDIHTNFLFTEAVLSQHCGMASIQEFGQDIQIVSFSRTQIILIVFFSVLPRLGISFVLGYVGIFFLMYTSNVEDLLLNAMALLFVLEIDEMLFEALLPSEAKRVMRMVEPLKISRKRSYFKSGSLPLAVQILSTVLVIAICNEEIIGPFAESMDEALWYLCGGKTDVVYREHKAHSLVMVANTPSFDTVDAYKITYSMAAVLKAIGLSSKGGAAHFEPLEVTLEGLEEMSKMGMIEAAGEVICIDHMNEQHLLKYFREEHSRQAYLSNSRELLQVENCTQLSVSRSCLAIDQIESRTLCARHCGCDNPWSGQPFSTGLYGCPTACNDRWQLNAYYLPPRRIAHFTDHCMDVPVEVLSSEPSWKAYAAGIQSYIGAKMSNATGLDDVLITLGCGFVAFLKGWLNFCKPGDRFRSVRLWCPATCGCAIADMSECPRSCSTSKSFMLSQDLCPLGLSIESPAECELGFRKLGLEGTATLISGNLPPSGCSVDHAHHQLMWSTSNLSFLESNRARLCRQAMPLPYDQASHGLVWLGQSKARCTLEDHIWDPVYTEAEPFGRCRDPDTP